MDGPDSSRPPDATTLHVRRARDGDAASVAWLVERFSPLLLAQARYRLGPRLAARVDPEDLVQDVWAVALPRLDALGSDERRATPTVLRFLVTTLLYRVNNLLRQAASAASRGLTESVAALPASTRGPATRVVATEAARLTQAAIDELPARDRELVLLRGIEQRPNDEVARILGLGPNAASQAYRRALERLRARLPSSVFDEL